MIKAAIKSNSDLQVLVLGLGETDIESLKAGKPILLDLNSVDIGFWTKNKGGRAFIQPRDSHIVLMPGDQTEDLGDLIGHKLPKLKKT